MPLLIPREHITVTAVVVVALSLLARDFRRMYVDGSCMRWERRRENLGNLQPNMLAWLGFFCVEGIHGG